MNHVCFPGEPEGEKIRDENLNVRSFQVSTDGALEWFICVCSLPGWFCASLTHGTERPHRLLVKNTLWSVCSDLLGWWPAVFTWSADQNDYYRSWIGLGLLQLKQSGKLGDRDQRLTIKVINRGWKTVFMRKTKEVAERCGRLCVFEGLA